jgi:hypothetical protein
VAKGAFDVYGDEHNFIVFLYVPVVITPLSYFVDHHLRPLIGAYPFKPPPLVVVVDLLCFERSS